MGIWTCERKGQIENSGWTTTTFNSLLTATYAWKISEAWDFDALLGNEIVQDNNKYYWQYGGTYNFPGWNHINNTVTKDNEEKQSSQRTVGFFGSLSASYKNMLYLNVTGRNDYVSTMPAGNRSFFYPSVSVGWILTELEPLKNEIVITQKYVLRTLRLDKPGNTIRTTIRLLLLVEDFIAGHL